MEEGLALRTCCNVKGKFLEVSLNAHVSGGEYSSVEVFVVLFSGVEALHVVHRYADINAYIVELVPGYAAVNPSGAAVKVFQKIIVDYNSLVVDVELAVQNVWNVNVVNREAEPVEAASFAADG